MIRGTGPGPHGFAVDFFHIELEDNWGGVC